MKMMDGLKKELRKEISDAKDLAGKMDKNRGVLSGNFFKLFNKQSDKLQLHESKLIAMYEEGTTADDKMFETDAYSSIEEQTKSLIAEWKMRPRRSQRSTPSRLQNPDPPDE